jgi:hypothetical protein
VEEKDDTNGTMKKTRCGPYNKWFAPTLWPTIFVAIKKHRNLITTLNHLQTFEGKVHGLYAKLSRTLYEFFAPIRAIKNKYKAYVDVGSSFIKSPQHCLVLATYSNIEQKIIQTL